MNRERKNFNLTSGESGWLVGYDSTICDFKLCNELNVKDIEYNICSTPDYYLYIIPPSWSYHSNNGRPNKHK